MRLGRDVQDCALVSIKTVWRAGPRLIPSQSHGDTYVDAQHSTRSGHSHRCTDGDGMRWQRLRHRRTTPAGQHGSRHAVPDVHSHHAERERG